MKAASGTTAKHAGGTKHAGSGKHKPTKAQQAARAAAAKKWQAAGAHAAHLHAVAKAAGHPQPAKFSPGADVACCAIEALAASLRMSGHEVTDADVLDLYHRITDDPDAGARIEDALEAAATHGLAGVRLLDARPATHLGDGVVLGLELAQRHAVTLEAHGVWTWGAWRPASCSLLAGADEAWLPEWAVA